MDEEEIKKIKLEHYQRVMESGRKTLEDDNATPESKEKAKEVMAIVKKSFAKFNGGKVIGTEELLAMNKEKLLKTMMTDFHSGKTTTIDMVEEIINNPTPKMSIRKKAMLSLGENCQYVIKSLRDSYEDEPIQNLLPDALKTNTRIAKEKLETRLEAIELALKVVISFYEEADILSRCDQNRKAGEEKVKNSKLKYHQATIERAEEVLGHDDAGEELKVKANEAMKKAKEAITELNANAEVKYGNDLRKFKDLPDEEKEKVRKLMGEVNITVDEKDHKSKSQPPKMKK